MFLKRQALVTNRHSKAVLKTRVDQEVANVIYLRQQASTWYVCVKPLYLKGLYPTFL